MATEIRIHCDEKLAFSLVFSKVNLNFSNVGKLSPFVFSKGRDKATRDFREANCRS